ncbi:suppressor of cytokine signaling 2 [Oncorhynchus kisutch]|uniref:Suppressor of cytokine signaling 2 n=1 Tax=Oncorhynchus kisutch TaxID=8019 RepID=A0A8C7KV47_ONCKI|nr:suppressor of cytokine signaling 2 [Oncorhynchus kisutch]
MPKSSGVPLPSGPMIIPTSAPDKSLNAVWLKDSELEPRRIESREDAARLQRAMSHLQESGWYWGLLTAAQAKQVLIDAPEGTFLLRDSSYQGYLLTLSVKTSLGPTHLRIEYATGMFGFDSVIVARPRLRRFEGAVDLVQHYALTYKHLATQNDTGGGNPSVPTEKTLQLKLTRPLHKVSPSLQHLCRITINEHSRCHQDLPLPRRLRDFLLEYPFVL